MEDSYEQPLFTALTEEIMFGGVPRNAALLNSGINGSLFINTSSLMLGFTAVFTHLVLARLAKDDQHFFDIFLRQLKQKKRYGV